MLHTTQFKPNYRQESINTKMMGQYKLPSGKNALTGLKTTICNNILGLLKHCYWFISIVEKKRGNDVILKSAKRDK